MVDNVGVCGVYVCPLPVEVRSQHRTCPSLPMLGLQVTPHTSFIRWVLEIQTQVLALAVAGALFTHYSNSSAPKTSSESQLTPCVHLHV